MPLHVRQVDNGFSGSATFTPAAASHTAGDSFGTAQEFSPKLGTPGGRVRIIGASLIVSNATNETTAWTLHMFSATPASALADDAPFVLPAGDRATYQGAISLAQLVDFGDTLYIATDNIFKPIMLSSTGSVFAYLTNTITVTPGAVAHTATLHTELF
jgi:hypothetical protein